MLFFLFMGGEGVCRRPSVDAMHPREADSQREWLELGQHCSLLELNLRTLRVAVARKPRLKGQAIFVGRIEGALVQAALIKDRLADCDIEEAQNVWCFLAGEFLLAAACSEIFAQDPEGTDNERLAFRLTEMQRLQQWDCPHALAPSDASWFDAERSYSLLGVNVSMLLQVFCRGAADEYYAGFLSCMEVSRGIDAHLKKKKKSKKSDREAWRYLAARHLADKLTASALVSLGV